MNIKKGNKAIRFNFKVAIISIFTLLMILITIFLGNNLGSNNDDYGVTYIDNTVEEEVEDVIYSYSHIEYEGLDNEGLDNEGFNREGYDRAGFNPAGYDKKGYDKKGYDKVGY